MGKEVLSVGAFAFTDGTNFYSYGVTAQDITREAAEIDLTDTFTSKKDRDYQTGRIEATGNVTIWKQADEVDPPIKELMTEALLDFEGYVYYGQFYFTKITPEASIDEGISQTFAMRFIGEIFNANNNLIVDAGGYGTSDWSDPGTNFTIGTGVSLSVEQWGSEDNRGVLEVTNSAIGAGQFFMRQNVTYPVSPDETLIMFHAHKADQDIYFQSDSADGLSEESFPATTQRMLYFKRLSYNAARNMIRFRLNEPVVNGNQLIIDNINLFQTITP